MGNQDAVLAPFAMAHIIVAWVKGCRVSLWEQQAALDMARQMLECPRWDMRTVTELSSLSNGVPTLTQSMQSTQGKESVGLPRPWSGDACVD